MHYTAINFEVNRHLVVWCSALIPLKSALEEVKSEVGSDSDHYIGCMTNPSTECNPLDARLIVSGRISWLVCISSSCF